MQGISKRFLGVSALEKVDFAVRKGTVHALMGENGAGKSTLMKIMLGIYVADEGRIIYNGKELGVHSIAKALELGISMIHQELTFVPERTVAENIFLGRELSKKSIWVDDKKMEEEVSRLFAKFDLKINPGARMKDLSTAYCQMVEIIKAVSYNAQLIIMDEPTSALAQSEVENLFRIIETLKKQGTTVIYITHRMDEVFRISDEVTVLRDGRYIGTKSASALDKASLIQMMVGRELTQMFPTSQASRGEILMEVRNYTYGKYFKNISFCVHRGEILGFSGLMGAGRSELFLSLFGITRHDQGDVLIQGEPVVIKNPKDAISHKMGLVTEDRKETGIFPELSVADNMMMPDFNKYRRALLLAFSKIKKECENQKKRLGIKTPTIQQKIGKLSGGNQQKVLLSRWMLMDPDILIIDEPTRGIDVGAKFEIHKLLCELAENGKAVIMISSEMPEIIGMCDRIIVMHEGRITGELNRDEATQVRIMELATGGIIQNKERGGSGIEE